MAVNYRAIAEQAMTSAIDLREKWRREDDSPLDVYALCTDMGVTVRFVDVPSMEGLYGRRPDGTGIILLPAQRPLPRRAFSCGHELGHHVFGHGSSIDQMIGVYTDRKGASFDPNEFLVDTFTGFLLMPTLGVRSAFASRGWKAGEATPEQVFTVACSFGVGYDTLISHMAFSLRMLPRDRAQALRKDGPKSIRQRLLEQSTSDPLIIVDRHWVMPTVDAEVGTVLLFPSNTEVDDGGLTAEGTCKGGLQFRAHRTGIFRACIPGTSWAVFVRIARKDFVGLAQYRHLESEEFDRNE